MTQKFDLGATDLTQYDRLTEEEKLAWLNPRQDSYHSFHVERMGVNTFRWRDSKQAKFYIGTLEELTDACCDLQLRKLDPKFLEAQQSVQVLKILTQTEIDDLLSDI